MNSQIKITRRQLLVVAVAVYIFVKVARLIAIQLCHPQLGDLQATLPDGVEDFVHMRDAVRFDYSQSPEQTPLETITRSSRSTEAPFIRTIITALRYNPHSFPIRPIRLPLCSLDRACPQVEPMSPFERRVVQRTFIHAPTMEAAQY